MIGTSFALYLRRFFARWVLWIFFRVCRHSCHLKRALLLLRLFLLVVRSGKPLVVVHKGVPDCIHNIKGNEEPENIQHIDLWSIGEHGIPPGPKSNSSD